MIRNVALHVDLGKGSFPHKYKSSDQLAPQDSTRKGLLNFVQQK